MTAAGSAAALSISPGKNVLLKTDVRGRLRTSQERRQTILEEFDRSGLSGAQFARLVGIKYSTFAQWVQNRRSKSGSIKSRRESTGSKAQAPLRLLEAIVDPSGRSASSACSGVKLQLPGGVVLEFSSADQVPLVAALVKGLQLSGSPC
jgi:transposase-like protein